ncbi:MAG: hypothetical protein GY754_42565 [bacterium]|nr:hypothetical protein [bacterium]
MSITFLRHLEKKIIDDLANDQDLRSSFMANPKAVLQDKYNLSIPGDMSVNVHEDNANTINVVLPPGPDKEPYGCW